MQTHSNKGTLTEKNVYSEDSEQQFIKKNLPLVNKIAKHLLSRLPSCVQFEDLVQAGLIGLLEAHKNYDSEKGSSFETYASIRIRGAMLDEIRKGDWTPRSVHRVSRKIAEAIRLVENQTSRDAKDHEVAKILEVSLESYHQMLQDIHGIRIFAYNDVGLQEETMSEGITATLLNPFDDLQQEAFRSSLARGIAQLPERERLVLYLYYEEDLNLRQVGEILGVSESRVSQIHSQATLRLQARLKEWNVEDEFQ